MDEEGGAWVSRKPCQRDATSWQLLKDLGSDCCLFGKRKHEFMLDIVVGNGREQSTTVDYFKERLAGIETYLPDIDLQLKHV